MNVCLSPCSIVFDLDGTLIDSAPDINACVNTVLDQHGAPLRAALAGLGADPRHPKAFHVGESELDAACAAAVPVPFLIFSQGYRQAPLSDLPHMASFDLFADLPALVEVQAAT